MLNLIVIFDHIMHSGMHSFATALIDFISYLHKGMFLYSLMDLWFQVVIKLHTNIPSSFYYQGK